MDQEEIWTERIKQRQGNAFFAYGQRMWKYAVSNGLTPSDTKILRRDYGRSVLLAQGFGFAAIIYWNYVAMSTFYKLHSLLHSIDLLGREKSGLFSPRSFFFERIDFLDSRGCFRGCMS